MELKTVGKFSSCISDVDFELLNTEFTVDLCLGFRKPNSCVGFEFDWKYSDFIVNWI